MSAIIFGSTLISASIYSQILVGVGGQGWYTRYGIFGTAFIRVGTLPIALSILLGIIGIQFLRKE